MHIKDIKPEACCGFKNIFVHCGINDIKQQEVNSPQKVHQKFDELKAKIEQILVLCPDSKLFVSPIMPTKSPRWNRRALDFNQKLFEYCNQTGNKFSTLDFNDFCDAHGNLRDDFGKYYHPSDQLHLGSKGINAFVKVVRQKVFSNTTNSRLFSDVLRGHSVSRENTSHGAVETSSSRSTAT